MDSVNGQSGGVFFVYGYGGTGKTYIWRTLCAAIRKMGEIVLPVASSAALLLPKGRTAHSSIRPGSDLAALLMRTNLIIWDNEAPMMHKYCFEALDRSLKDIMQAVDRDNLHRPFGGKVVFGGDLRQIFPVIPKGTRQDIVFATLNSSFLWDLCKVLKLTRNMRLQSCSSSSTANEIREFSEWILSVGDGRARGPNDGEVDIEISEDILIDGGDDPISSLSTAHTLQSLIIFGKPNTSKKEQF
ncbi:uncharacterized protein LOC125498657 [Beta vulgaris subsp. vulgaris]|uniref:uncharacterized protein LOC125498657 n=1 Tax=Beta vulgaris subsp. vulgaris TaxID=3555 RepID=UPI0025492513|nr:uncharacterized protein LOC125498657 [Beta vulgaris subsp. vulgaris]